MGFLDGLWDETLAGPAPEKGLGKLRKYKSLSAVRSPNHPIVANRYKDHHDNNNNQTAPVTPRHHNEDHDNHNQTVPVTRSITILRTKSLSVDPGSAASSPSSSSGASTPFSPGGTGKSPDVKRPFTRKKPAFETSEQAQATSPTVYDWIMISALDR